MEHGEKNITHSENRSRAAGDDATFRRSLNVAIAFAFTGILDAAIAFMLQGSIDATTIAFAGREHRHRCHHIRSQGASMLRCCASPLPRRANHRDNNTPPLPFAIATAPSERRN
ncbi:hypothetical protein E2542_SST08707 [Spatholobus suberectus]|nr:hypothetical protein E2542_SST08707 [Spatholobus suberectus]